RTRIGVLEYWADPKRKFDRSGRRGDRIDDVPDPAPPLGSSSGSPPMDSSGNDGDPVPKLGLPRLLEPIRTDWYGFWEHAVKGGLPRRWRRGRASHFVQSKRPRRGC